MRCAGAELVWIDPHAQVNPLVIPIKVMHRSDALSVAQGFVLAPFAACKVWFLIQSMREYVAKVGRDVFTCLNSPTLPYSPKMFPSKKLHSNSASAQLKRFWQVDRTFL